MLVQRLLVTPITAFLLWQGEEVTSMSTGNKQYYRTWVSYQIPMRPVDPIDYLATESMKSFYVGEHDASHNLVRFTKYLREHGAKVHTTLPTSKSPGMSVYFTAVPDREGQYKPGAEIPYSATEGSGLFFQGHVTKSGDGADLVLVRTSVFFDDEYSYWPNQHLRTRIMHKKDGTVIRSLYDESGNEVQK